MQMSKNQESTIFSFHDLLFTIKIVIGTSYILKMWT